MSDSTQCVIDEDNTFLLTYTQSCRAYATQQCKNLSLEHILHQWDGAHLSCMTRTAGCLTTARQNNMKPFDFFQTHTVRFKEAFNRIEFFLINKLYCQKSSLSEKLITTIYFCMHYQHIIIIYIINYLLYIGTVQTFGVSKIFRNKLILLFSKHALN